MLSLDGSGGGPESGPTAGGNYIKIQAEDGAMNQVGVFMSGGCAPLKCVWVLGDDLLADFLEDLAKSISAPDGRLFRKLC